VTRFYEERTKSGRLKKQAPTDYHEFPPGEIIDHRNQAIAESKRLALAYSPGVVRRVKRLSKIRECFCFTAEGQLGGRHQQWHGRVGLGAIGRWRAQAVRKEGGGVKNCGNDVST